MKQLFHLILVFSTSILLLSSCSQPPVAKFSANTPEGTAPVTVQFTNSSTNAEKYLWDFGDGNTSNEAAPSHEYKRGGEYTVKLTARKGDEKSASTATITIKRQPRRVVEINTPFGAMQAELFNETPKHRDNFLKLAQESYFDSLLFHRVISGFMIQGGDPDSRNATPDQQLGQSGPGYTIPAEFVDGLYHFKGALSAARKGDMVNPEKASSGSQFYVVQGKPTNDQYLNAMESRKGFKYSAADRQKYQQSGGTPQLDRDYTVFGQVISGLEIVDKIAAVQKGVADRPVEDVWMTVKVVK